MIRALHRFYARACGYFWLPCRICGEPFGGHEIGLGTAALVVREAGGVHAYVVCPKPECSREAERRNAANPDAKGRCYQME